MCLAPVAGARQPHRAAGGTVVTPAHAGWLAEFTAQIYSLPASENPWVGNGNPCLIVGHKVLEELLGGPSTIQEGWVFTLGFGSAWSTAEYPFPQTRADQCAASRAQDEPRIKGIHVIVDGGAPVEIFTRPFEHCSPQRTVLIPADNILDDVQGPVVATVTGHGWDAAVRNLRPGRHMILGEAELTDGRLWSFPHTVIVVPKHATDR